MRSNNQRKQVRYSISFKQMVVKEIEEGGCFEEVRRKYGLGGTSTIQRWVKALGRDHLLNKIVRIETMTEKDKLKALEEENKRLKMALADTFLAKDCLEAVIKMANEEYKTDLKKNFADQLPNSSKKDMG